MDIAALSMALAKSDLQTNVGVAVLDKAMESSDTFSAGLMQMMDHSMELSVNPNIGSNIDISV